MVCGCCCAGLVFAAIVIYKVLDWLVRKPQIGALSSRCILITGCDTGFGNEISKRLDKLGCTVFAGCLTERGEEELRKSCSSRLKTVHLNVANHESVLKAYAYVKANLPENRGLWGIHNNAGIVGFKMGPMEWLTLKDYQDVFDINLLGAIDVTTTFLPLVKKERGRIVSTASVFGRTSLVGNAAYSISKYGVEAFSDSIRKQLKPFKISVHLIEPGFHKTNITSVQTLSKSLKAAWEQTTDEIRQEYGTEYLDKSLNTIIGEDIQRLCSENIADVVDAYEHALLAMYPRARYVVGKDAKYFWLPLQWLPEWLGDWILLNLNKKRKPIPAACKT